MDKGKLTALVLLDLSKAFDSINHLILLEKLQIHGVSAEAIQWFKSYLSDRSQSVRIGSVFSTALPITHGVPQGSILGPILFNIYINDLPTIPRVCDLESFVDDSKLLLSFFINNAEASSNFITEDLQRVAAWCCANSLLMNPDKTKLLLLGTRQMLNQVPQNFHVILLGKQIFPVFQAKDLGIILDASMTFDEHVTNVVSSCIAGLCQINRAKHIFDKQTLINIINALIFSKLYYGSTIWSNTSSKNVKKLQLVQNFAARIVSGSNKYEHITPVLQQLNWLPVSYMLQFRELVMSFRCVNNLAPEYLCNKFKRRSAVHDLHTRNKNELDIPFFKTASGQRTFVYRATRLWNNVNTEVKDSTHTSVSTFKKQMKFHLFNEFLNT